MIWCHDDTKARAASQQREALRCSIGSINDCHHYFTDPMVWNGCHVVVPATEWSIVIPPKSTDMVLNPNEGLKQSIPSAPNCTHMSTDADIKQPYHHLLTEV